MAANNIAALVKAGLIKLWQSPAKGDILNAGRIAFQRKAVGLKPSTGVKYYAANRATDTLIDKIGKPVAKKVVGPRVDAATGILSEKAAQVTNAAIIQPGFKAYGKLLFRNPPKSVYQVLNAQTKVLRAYHHPASRFARSAINRGLVDYATYQLINIGTQLVEEVLPGIGPTAGDDKMDWTPFDQIQGTPGGDNQTEHDDVGQQLLAIAANTLVSQGVNRATGRLRRNSIGLNQVQMSNAPQYGRRLAENTMAAKSYYGSRVPEVAGQIVGGFGSLVAIGGDPKEVLMGMGVRGITNAGVGFYNVGRSSQERLPNMGPSLKTRIKGIKKAKPVNRVQKTVKEFRSTYNKTTKIQDVAMQQMAKYRDQQGSLF